MSGTPKHLEAAIHKGIKEWANALGEKSKSVIIACHVQDFIAQRFQVSMMENPECTKVLKNLFCKLVEKGDPT